jgi:hypothetical protein
VRGEARLQAADPAVVRRLGAGVHTVAACEARGRCRSCWPPMRPSCRLAPPSSTQAGRGGLTQPGAPVPLLAHAKRGGCCSTPRLQPGVLGVLLGPPGTQRCWARSQSRSWSPAAAPCRGGRSAPGQQRQQQQQQPRRGPKLGWRSTGLALSAAALVPTLTSCDFAAKKWPASCTATTAASTASASSVVPGFSRSKPAPGTG